MDLQRRRILVGSSAALVVAPAALAEGAGVPDVRSGASAAALDEYRKRPFVDLLRDCYLDELVGESLFSGIVEHRPARAHDQGVMAVLAIVERNVHEHLAYVLRRNGQSWDEQYFRHRAAREAQGFLESMKVDAITWPAINDLLETSTVHYSVKYRALAERAPPEDSAVMGLLVRHEQAFAQLARGERESENPAGLQGVWSILGEAQRLASQRG